MSLHLIVAHQTAASPELITELKRIAEAEPETQFVLLVPATPVTHLLTRVDDEAGEVARERALDASHRLRDAGLNVVDTVIGPADPLQAITGEAGRRQPPYAGVVISTFPVGMSQWLKRDLPTQARKKLNIPVTHVVTMRPVEVRKGAAGRPL